MEILDGCQCKCSWFFPGCITTAYGETKDNGNNQNTTKLKELFNRLLLELIKNVHLSSFLWSALSEGPYQTPPSLQLFAKQRPQTSPLHFLTSARGTQSPSQGNLWPPVAASAKDWAEIPLQAHPKLGTQGHCQGAKLLRAELGREESLGFPGPRAELKALESPPEAGRGPAPLFMGCARWCDRWEPSGACRIQPNVALFSWFINGFWGRQEFQQRGLRSKTVSKKFWAS